MKMCVIYSKVVVPGTIVPVFCYNIELARETKYLSLFSVVKSGSIIVSTIRCSGYPLFRVSIRVNCTQV